LPLYADYFRHSSLIRTKPRCEIQTRHETEQDRYTVTLNEIVCPLLNSQISITISKLDKVMSYYNVLLCMHAYVVIAAIFGE